MPGPALDVVFAHHWLMGMRGGERTLEAMLELFPQAPVHALAGVPERLSPAIRAHPLRFSRLRLLPGYPRFFRAWLPLFPAAVRAVRVPECRVLLSSDASVIKGIRKPPGATHVCYCHSPPRYLWEMQDLYLAGLRRRSRALHATASAIFSRLREFDREAAAGVDRFIANSAAVADRIRRHYGREPDAVIHPPVETARFLHDRPRENFHLVVSELTAYKRVDLAVEAFRQLRRPLVVIGSGPEMRRLAKDAPPNVTFMGWQDDATVRHYLERAKAFLFPGEEDFGIAPVEAMAAGCPVVAYGAGGALETVVDGETGVFFREQSAEALAEAVLSLERREGFDTSVLRNRAESFDRPRFQKKIREFLRPFLG